MDYTHAIVRKPGPDFASGLASNNLGKADLMIAGIQHDAYVAALRYCGVQTIILESLPGFPDCPFVEDTAVVLDELAIITYPGHPSRRGEVISVADVLSDFRPIRYIQSPGTLDGGDVLQMDRKLFVGISGRTNEEGADQLASHAAEFGYNVVRVTIQNLLHLKEGVNRIDENTLILHPQFDKSVQFKEYHRIVVEKENFYSANCLQINDTLLFAGGFPESIQQVRLHTQKVIELDMSEFQKLDGGLTCLSIPFRAS